AESPDEEKLKVSPFAESETTFAPKVHIEENTRKQFKMKKKFKIKKSVMQKIKALTRWSLQKEIAKPFETALTHGFFRFDHVPCIITLCFRKEHGDYKCTSILDVWPDMKKAGGFNGPTHAGLSARYQLLLYGNYMIESCLASALGFLHFKLSSEWIARSIHKMIKDGIDTWAPKLSEKRAIIYFWSRNVAKKMSMGHLRSIVIGETLARMLEYSRVEVIRRFHEGDDLDIKSKMMMTEFLIERFPIGELNDQAIGEPEVLYEESRKRFDKDAEFRERAQQGKSLYDPYISKTLDLSRGKGLSIDGEGVFIEGRKLPLADLAALWHALDMVKADWIVHVTDVGKQDYIQMCINAAKHAGWIVTQHSRISHVGFGLVEGDDLERFVDLNDLLDEAKSRCKAVLVGQATPLCTRTLVGEPLEAVSLGAGSVYISLPPYLALAGLGEAALELEHIAKALGYGAVKYADLKKNRLTNYKFSFDQILDEEVFLSSSITSDVINEEGRKQQVARFLQERKKKEADLEGGSMSYQVPILTSVNYPVWSVKVKSIMDAYGLWGTVEPRGLGEEPDEKKSKQALAFLFQAIPEDMVLQMASYTDPKQVWDGLKTRFLGVDRVRTARLATLRKELETMRMKEGETVDDFVAKLNGIASKVRSLGYELEEVDLVKRLLDSMPKPFFQIVASIEQCFDLDSMFFDEAVGRLKAFEERLKGLGEKEEEQGQVLMAEHKYGESSGQGRGRGRSYGRDERGRGRGTGRGGDKSRFRCFDCGEFGHFGYECTKWKDKDEANLIQDEEPALLLKVPPLETETIPAARVPSLTLADFEDFEFDWGRFKVPLLETETVPTSLESTAYFSEATEEQLRTSFGTGPYFRFEVYKVVPRHRPNIDPYVYNVSGYDERELPLFGMIKAQNTLSDPSHDGSFYMFNADGDADPDPSVYTSMGCFYMFNRDSVDPLVLTSDAISPPEICYHSIQVSTSLKLTCKLYGIAFKELISFKNMSEYFKYLEAQPELELPLPKLGQKTIENDVLQFCDDCHDINFSEYFAKKPRGGFASCKLKGKDGYLEFYYAALKYAVDATLEVDFNAPSKDTVVVGRVVAYYGKDFDYDCDAAREDHHYAKMFETTPEGFLLPGKINLMRSVLAVPAQFSLIIVAELRDFSSKKVILSGSYEFHVPLYDPSSFGSIKSNDGFSLGLKVGWKLPL
ncbi:anticodon-binding aminoacyl-tRNA synthetase, class 1a, partial [Tanacetum coccineum]